MKPVLVAVICLLASNVLSAQDASLPALSGRVVDQANILAAATEQRLTAQLQAHEKAGGNQVIVATIASLDGDTIERYGVRLGRAWAIGEAGKNNGIVLIVAPNERKVRIEVGYGLEGDIPDAIASNIIQTKILPRFWENNFDGGVMAGVTAIIAALGGDYVFEQKQRKRREGGFPFGFLWVVIVFVLFGVGRRRRRGIGSGLLWGVLLGSALGGGRGGSSSGGFSGGGFSGGGGSFGGGGASGGW